MALAQRLSNEPSQITLQLQLSSRTDNSGYQSVASSRADSREYRVYGNASCLAVPIITIARIVIKIENPLVMATTMAMESTITRIIVIMTKTFTIAIIICEIFSSREDAQRMKIYEDVFSSDDKAQLFSSSSPYPSDCVITLKDNKEVRANKTILCLNSEYFKDMFSKDNANSVTLDTIEYEEFVELLSVIYPSGHPITAKNVETLSKLASEFKMPDLLKRCDVFLMVSSKNFGKAKILLMAQDYGLKRLQTHFICEYKSIEDVKAIKNEPEYASLNYQTRRMFLDNIIEANAYSVPPVAYVSKSNCIFYSIDPAVKQAREAEILEELASPTFCAPDIVLVVGDKRIQAHKQFLSIYSQYFNTMLQSEFKEGRENEVVLEEVGFEEILELLSVVYPIDYTITETNIGRILKLADRFIMPAILARCAKKLKKMNNINGALKLWFAQQYNLANLQEEFARNYKIIADVLNLKVETEFDLLDDKTRALILDNITQ